MENVENCDFSMRNQLRKYAIINAVSSNPDFKGSDDIANCFSDEIVFHAIDDFEAYAQVKLLQKQAETKLQQVKSSGTLLPNYNDHLYVIIDEEENDYRKVPPPVKAEDAISQVMSQLESVDFQSETK